MYDRTYSFPVFISSGDSSDKPMTGYTCPSSRRAIVKSVTVSNETVGSGYVTLSWRDVNDRMIPYPGGLYSLLTSGYIPPYGRLKLLDDYIVIEENEPLILNTLTETTGNFTAFFSVIEKDLYPDIVTITPKTLFYTGANDYIYDMYTVPENKKAIIRNITVNNETSQTSYATAIWRDNNNRGLGSTLNDYIIFQSGEMEAYERYRGIEDIVTLEESDVLKVRYINDVGNCVFIVTVLEEDA